MESGGVDDNDPFFVEIRQRHLREQIAAKDARIAELERALQVAQNEASDLRGFIDGLKPHIEAAANMYGLGKGKSEGL